MSERLSSAEIEDVLSSIRRLVSEDLRASASSAGRAPAPPAAEDGPGRLLLTPSLRIVAPDGGQAAAAEDAAPEAAAAAADLSEADADVARLEALLDEAAQGLPPAAEEDAPAVPDAPAWFDVPDDLPPSDGPQTVSVVAVKVVSAGQAAAEAAGQGAGDATGAAPAAEKAATGGPDAVTEAVADVLTAGVEDFEAELDAKPQGAAANDFRDPEAGGSGAESRWADAAEAEIRRKLQKEAEESVFARFDASRSGPALDPEALGDLVREIIREELQGALGERITRNVRKLVRSEIARAMAVRDFE